MIANLFRYNQIVVVKAKAGLHGYLCRDLLRRKGERVLKGYTDL